MDEECLFCKFRSLERYSFLKVVENDYFFSVFDSHPVSLGHALVIPKEHVVSLFDLDEEQWGALREMIVDTVDVIKKTDFKKLYLSMKELKFTEKSEFFCDRMLEHGSLGEVPQGFNVGVNEGEVAGRTIHHLHVQVIPRFKGDVVNPIGGVRNIFASLGDYKS